MDKVTQFCTTLHLACKSLQFYAADHPRSIEALTALERSVEAMLSDRSRIAIAATKGTLMADGTPIVSTSPAVRGIARELEARQIGGFVVTHGVTMRELAEFVQALNMKLRQLNDEGGADEILRKKDVIHIRMSRVRYEAVTEGEEVVWSKSVRRDVDPGDATGDLTAALQRYLLGFLNEREAADGDSTAVRQKAAGTAADAAGIEQLLAESLSARIEQTGPQPAENAARDVLRDALVKVEPALQLALLVSIERLPPSVTLDPFRSAARSLASETSTPAAISGSSNDAVAALTAALGGSSPGLDLLRGRIESLGISREQVDELLQVIGWDKLSADDKVRKLLEGEQALDIPADRLVAFIRELATTARYADVLAVLERYARGFDHDSHDLRQSVTDVFAQVAQMIETPGLSAEVEQLLVRVMLIRCTREPDSRLHRGVAEATANLITSTAATGRCDAAMRILSRLESATRVAPPDAPVHETFRLLVGSIGESRRAQPLINQLVTADAESLGRSVLPLVIDLGATLAPAIIEALGTEEDRNRRGRLVKALKAIGKPAYPSLMDALQSSTWYVVRNALMVLGDIGSPAHVGAIGRKIDYGDQRVRRASARALAKIGGAEAERFLIDALADRNSEMQSEVLLCLGSLRAESAVPAVMQVAKSRLLGGDDKIRELAIATLGQIGSDAAIEFLADIVRPRSMFNREPLPIRTAAANALAQAPAISARQVLQSALAAETDSVSKEMLAASLARTQS